MPKVMAWKVNLDGKSGDIPPENHRWHVSLRVFETSNPQPPLVISLEDAVFLFSEEAVNKIPEAPESICCSLHITF